MLAMPWFDDAEKAFRDSSQAIEANPNDTKAYLYRGAAQECLSRPDEAFATKWPSQSQSHNEVPTATHSHASP